MQVTSPSAPAAWANPEFSPALPPPPAPASPLDGPAARGPTDWSGLPAPSFVMADMGQPSAFSPQPQGRGPAGLSEFNNKQPLRADYPLPDVHGLPMLTPVARAAAQVAAPGAAAAPVAPAAPSADPMDRATLVAARLPHYLY